MPALGDVREELEDAGRVLPDFVARAGVATHLKILLDGQPADRPGESSDGWLHPLAPRNQGGRGPSIRALPAHRRAPASARWQPVGWRAADARDRSCTDVPAKAPPPR